MGSACAQSQRAQFSGVMVPVWFVSRGTPIKKELPALEPPRKRRRVAEVDEKLEDPVEAAIQASIKECSVG